MPLLSLSLCMHKPKLGINQRGKQSKRCAPRHQHLWCFHCCIIWFYVTCSSYLGTYRPNTYLLPCNFSTDGNVDRHGILFIGMCLHFNVCNRITLLYCCEHRQHMQVKKEVYQLNSILRSLEQRNLLHLSRQVFPRSFTYSTHVY